MEHNDFAGVCYSVCVCTLSVCDVRLCVGMDNVSPREQAGSPQSRPMMNGG